MKFKRFFAVLLTGFSVSLFAQAPLSDSDTGEAVPESSQIRAQEEEHEQSLLGMLDEERLQYVGSMVLGLNDALVELTGSLAGFAFALQNNRLIALSGLIVGISATFSMASSEFLAARSEGRGDALKSCSYTGIAYLITVVLLIAPYLLFGTAQYIPALICMLVMVVLIIAAVMAVGSGLLGTSIAMLGDMTDSISLYLNRAGAGWPANTGIRTPTQVEPLAGGFVEMDNEDVAVYSAYGAKIRTIQPGYARPALAVGNTRFVLYNRAGKELTVQSRTRQLYAKSFNNAIMLCEMAQNGTLAVVTESDRYAAEVMVYDASFSGDPFTWKLTSTDGTPIALSFATDNHRFAAATVAARDGQLRTTVRMMNTNSDTAGPFYVADTGSVILKLKWISSSRVLAVFDTYAAIINVSDGTESARYDYGGATLQSVSIGGRSTALLLAVRGGDTLVTLDDSLNQLASVAAAQAKKDRLAVAQHAEDGGKVSAADRLQKRLEISPGAGQQRSKDKLPQLDGNHTFAHIADGGQHRGQLAVGAQDISHTGIAAAVLAHIILVHDFGNQHAEQEAAQQIGTARRQQAGLYNVKKHSYTFPALTAPSPCSRVIILMGVAVRPKVSRIWFSRYR